VQALDSAETWTLRKVDQKCLERFEMWCQRRMEMGWKNRVRNEEVLHKVKEERNILNKMKKIMDNLICHILPRNCV
jgi:hypothetical protein